MERNSQYFEYERRLHSDGKSGSTINHQRRIVAAKALYHIPYGPSIPRDTSSYHTHQLPTSVFNAQLVDKTPIETLCNPFIFLTFLNARPSSSSIWLSFSFWLFSCHMHRSRHKFFVSIIVYENGFKPCYL